MTSLLWLYASQFLNCPYRWGANGPFEFDCSGLVVKSINLVRTHQGKKKLSDMSAQMIYDWHSQKAPLTVEPGPDTILYYGKDFNRISHIAIGGPGGILLEAGGGSSESAILQGEDYINYCTAHDARVRIKNFGHRKDFLAALPFE